VFALYAVDPGPMGLSKAGFGVLLTAGAVGAVIGSAIAPAVERRLGRTGALAASMAVFPIGQLVPAVTASPWIVAAFDVFVGAAVIWNIITVSLRQRIAPDNMLGRVNAGYRLLAWGSMPFGAALGGLLGELIGLRTTFVVCAVVGLLCVPLLLSGVSDRAIAAAEAAGEGKADRGPAPALT
jgi:predicted MFS family arabinose efflux permease